MIRMIILTACLLMVSWSMATAQGGQEEADKLMKKVQENIRTLEPLEAELELIIEFPEQGEETQEISVLQSGEKYRVRMDNMLIISDGKSRWTYLEPANEVQIDNAAKSEFQMGSMQGWMEMMGTGDYTYAITGEEMFEGQRVINIEFKPDDPGSPYSKARIRVSKDKSLPVAMEAFEKTGTRYTLRSKDMKQLDRIDDSSFTFNPDDYPDVFIEDLRID